LCHNDGETGLACASQEADLVKDSEIDTETDRLVTEMHAIPAYRGWQFSYEYPGYFCYSHSDNDYSVWFTPDWEEDEMLPIQVQVGDGRDCPEHSGSHPLPREGRTGRQIFALVKPTLDKLMEISATLVRARLTSEEVVALQKAYEFVRQLMAHEHSWVDRDTALSALGKILRAAQEAAQTAKDH
jgi:hypothetical protein